MGGRAVEPLRMSRLKKEQEKKVSFALRLFRDCRTVARTDARTVLLAAPAVGLVVEKTLVMVMVLRGGRALY